APFVHLEQLHLEMIALLDDVLRLFGATMLQLGDVEQPFDPRDDLDERAKRGRALHDALIHLADFWLLHETGDDVAGTLCRFTYTRNRDHTRVLHVDLGAGLLLDAADRLALGTDEVADLIGTPASMSASEPEQTEAIDDEPLDSRISDTIRIV